MSDLLLEEDKPWDGRLSYSSFNSYMGCNRKYYLRKVLKVKPDPDAEEDTEAFRFGKAFHKLLEDSKHLSLAVTKKDIDEACKLYLLNSMDKGPLLFAMLRHYKKVTAKNKLIATHCEVEIKTPGFIGYVDAILKEPDSEAWWIADVKTGSSYAMDLNSKLSLDWQLNLYTAHLKEIAEATGYLVGNFQGCRYLLNVKSKQKRNPTDTFLSYAERLEKSVASYDIVVPKEDMSVDTVFNLFKLVKVEVDALHKMKPALAEKRALPNFNCCFSYYRPCEFWSKCKGKTFTEAKVREVISSED